MIPKSLNGIFRWGAAIYPTCKKSLAMNKNTWIIMALAGMIFTSCESFLDPEQDNRITEEQVKKIPQFAEGLLLNAYKNMPVQHDFVEAIISDEAVTNDLNSPYIKMVSGQWSAEENPVNYWESSLKQIYYINMFLEIGPQVRWSETNEILDSLHLRRLTGEAYALRAWYGFLLLKYHGGKINDGTIRGFPIQTKTLSVNDDWSQERSLYSDCVNQILEDCDSAISRLPIEYKDTSDPVYNQAMGVRWTNRVTALAAHALKSRVLLYAASPSFNPSGELTSWVKAATQTGNVINLKGGISALSPTGLTFFKYTTKNDADVIWARAITMSKELEAENFPPSLIGNGRTNPTQNLVDAFPMKNGYPINHSSSGFNSEQPYSNRDPRLTAYIIYNGSPMGFKGIINTHANATPDGINKQTNSTRTGYYVKKFLLDNVNVENPEVKQNHFYTYLRMTELFLNYAEAANEAWGPDLDPGSVGFTARQAIAAIRLRAGIDAADPYLAGLNSQEQFRELIRNERRLELCFEGHRFWDIRRWGDIETMKNPVYGVSIDTTNNSYDYRIIEIRNFKDHMVYGPVPQNELLKYNELKQNQGW
jgi:hypothetical protein